MSEKPETVARVTEHLRKLAHADGSVKCGICGSGIEGLATVCGSCETPHHPDCWKYNTGCSVYGCRAAPAPVPPIEVEITMRLAADAPDPAAPTPPPRRWTLRKLVVAVVVVSGLSALDRAVNTSSVTAPPAPQPAALPAVVQPPRQLPANKQVLPLPSKSHWKGLLQATERDAATPAKDGEPAIDIIFIDPSRGDQTPAKAPDVDAFVRGAKGADWESRVFFIKSLATSKEPKARDYLLAALADDGAIGNVREAAAEVLGERHDILAVPELVERAKREPVAQVRAQLALALDRIGSPHGRAFIEQWLAAYVPGQQGQPGKDLDRKALAMHAAQAAARGRMEEFRPAIESYLSDGDSWVLAFTLGNLGALGSSESIPAVARLLDSADCGTVHAACGALAELGARSYRSAIEKRLGKCPVYAGQLPGLLAKLDGREGPRTGADGTR